jgi:hypothetical protein
LSAFAFGAAFALGAAGAFGVFGFAGALAFFAGAGPPLPLPLATASWLSILLTLAAERRVEARGDLCEGRQSSTLEIVSGYSMLEC